MLMLIGLLGAVIAVVAWFGAAFWPARLIAQRLGLREFRLFDPYPQGYWGHRVLVRSTSIAAPVALSILWWFATMMILGQRVSTNRVTVIPGPAMDAGLRDGDRVVAVDGESVSDFRAASAVIQSSTRPHEVAYERDGAQVKVVVVPDEHGRVGLRAIEEQHPIAPTAAMAGALRLLGNDWKQALSSSLDRAQLAGPVAIAAEAKAGSSLAGAHFLCMTGIVGNYVARFVLFVHLTDCLLWWPLVRLMRLRQQPIDERMRTRQCMLLRRRGFGVLMAFVLIVLAAITALEVGGIEVVSGVHALTTAFATPPLVLVWLLTAQLYGWRRALPLIVVSAVPLVGLFVVVWVWVAVGRALRANVQ